MTVFIGGSRDARPQKARKPKKGSGKLRESSNVVRRARGPVSVFTVLRFLLVTAQAAEGKSGATS
jgi:hypothetical protein